MLILQLNGVAEFGSNPLEALRRSITGYRQQTPQSTINNDPLVAN
jgi:hypothetical protein